MMKYQLIISITFFYVMLHSFLIPEVAHTMDMDGFYRDYINQRIMIAKIRALTGNETASSLLKDLEEEAEEVGIRNKAQTSAGSDQLSYPREFFLKEGNKSFYEYDEFIQKASEINRLPPELITAVIRVESSFDRDAVSFKGAQGLMQLMPETADDLGISNPFDPRANIFGGTRLLKNHLHEFRSLKKALIAYNAGPTWVRNRKGIPKETKDYIRKVIKYYHIYKE
jgi:soluble lytic murein transglycosylase-like protein